MAPRERVRAALRFEPTDIVPYWIPMEPEVATRIAADPEGKALLGRIVNHVLGWHGIGDHGSQDLGAGRTRSPWGYVVRHGALAHLDQAALKRPTLDGYAWPEPESLGDWKWYAETFAKETVSFRLCGMGSGFVERGSMMRGVENFLMDMVEHPQFVHDFCDGYLKIRLELIDRIIDRIPVEGIFDGGDDCDQRGPMMGLALWREFIKPRLKAVVDHVHARGLPVVAHMCGNVRPLIDDLLEMILLQADVLDLRSNPKRKARGFVIEAQMESGMGPTAHLLVCAGTLSLGDVILCGHHWGRVRALVNDHGVKVKSIGPGLPVKCLGLSGVPEAGSEFQIVSTDRIARAVAKQEQARVKAGLLRPQKKVSLENLFDGMNDALKLELNLILRADAQGSVEAISQSLREIKSAKVTLNLLLVGAGNITVNDVMLASASSAVIMGFHVGKESGVPSVAKTEGVEIYLHTIIYELLDQVRDAMTGLLKPRIEERERGKAQIKQVFDFAKKGKVAGCIVTAGSVRPAFRVRVKRGADVLYKGFIASLRRFQDEAAEVRDGQECGIRLDNYSDIAEGDILEFYEAEEVKESL